ATEVMRPIYETEEEQRHVVDMRGTVVYGHGYGQTPDVPFFERFTAGGPGTLLEARGFEYRGLGPHEGSFPNGGLGGVIVNTEYIFPLIDLYDAKIRENTPFLRGLLFVDQGMLEPDWEDMAHGRWRISIGTGIRMRIPVQVLSAPLELYYSIPIQKAP